MTTVLLHGFWGQPQDWSAVIQRLGLTTQVIAPDLYEPSELSPQYELKEWTRHFLHWLKENAGQAPVQIVGYSMGARLALNALMTEPQRFHRALLLSGAAGFPPEALAGREEWERLWREKFLSQPWPELESAWQDQSVFAGSQATPRRRSENLREWLGLCLENWSVRRHEFTLQDLKSLGSRADWAFGALDQKYVSFAKTLQDLPVQGQITVIPNAGHRLITDAPDFIADWIERGHS